MEITFTNVFYENTYPEAQQRLNDLRERDKYPEVKAYIIQEKDGSWRVLRRIKITGSQTQVPSVQRKKYPKTKRLSAKKAGK